MCECGCSESSFTGRMLRERHGTCIRHDHSHPRHDSCSDWKPEAARQASQPSTQDCSNPYSEIEGEWQPSRASGERTPEQEIIFQEGALYGLTQGMTKCNELLDAAFQRGQQAMAEKAAQYLTGLIDNRPDLKQFLRGACKVIRSLAGAEPDSVPNKENE